MNAVMARRYGLDWMVSTDHGGPNHSKVNLEIAYLLFLIPVSWGSAAFGEEMLLRGFLLNRIEGLTRSAVWAVLGQAAIFALAHLYLGITGVLMVFVVALVFGAVYLRCGRNLWPVIVAHGLVDTVAMTALYLGLDWV